jgi:hypothetical protein
VLAAASEDVLEGALRAAWKLRMEKNAKAGKKTSGKAKRMKVAKARRKGR